MIVQMMLCELRKRMKRDNNNYYIFRRPAVAPAI